MEEKTKLALSLYDWLLNKEYSEFPESGFSFGNLVFMPQKMIERRYSGKEIFVGGEHKHEIFLDVLPV